MPKSLARVLIIAGSDSGGGAGIQGDIKTVTCLGGYASSAITALTAQNTQGVFGIHEVPGDFLAQQISLVLSDIGADAIKTGMLHSAEVIEVVAREIRSHAAPLILDPVMVAKGGSPLLKNDAVNALKSLLLPRAFMITPNIPEAELLAGMRIANVKEMMQAAEKIAALGPKHVLIKGGHLEGKQLTNVLLKPDGRFFLYETTRIPTKNTHGTGCTMASAIATFIAQGKRAEEAVYLAGKYVKQAIKNAPKIGTGHGPLGHFLKSNN